MDQEKKIVSYEDDHFLYIINDTGSSLTKEDYLEE